MAWFLSASTAKTSLLFVGFKARGNFVGFRGFLRGAIPPGIDFWLEQKERATRNKDERERLKNYFLEGTEVRGRRIHLGDEKLRRGKQGRALGAELESER